MHDTCWLHAWFIFNLHKNLVIFTNHSSQYLQDVQNFYPAQPLASLTKQPHFTYLKSHLFCSWWQILIHPCLWSAYNCLTPWLLPLSPFHTPQFKLHYLRRQHQQSQSSSYGTPLTSTLLSLNVPRIRKKIKIVVNSKPGLQVGWIHKKTRPMNLALLSL